MLLEYRVSLAKQCDVKHTHTHTHTHTQKEKIKLYNKYCISVFIEEL